MPGVVTTMSYDNFLRPLRIKSQAINGLSASGSITIPGTVQSPTGNVLMDSRYQYNEVGNITKRQTEHGDYQYAYDDLDRLTQAIPPSAAFTSTSGSVTLPNEIYSYDAVHNRKTSVHQPGSWTVNGNNQLTQYGVAGNAAYPQVMMSYDANGHTVSKTVTPEDPTNPDNANRQYGYNTVERLAQVKDGSNNEIAS